MFCFNSCEPVLLYFEQCRYWQTEWALPPWRVITVAGLEAHSRLCQESRQRDTFMRSRFRATPPIAAPSSQMWPCCKNSSLSSSPVTHSWWWWVFLGITYSSMSSAGPARCTMSPTSLSETWPSLTCSCVWLASLLLSPTPSIHMVGFLAAQCAIWCSSSSLSQSTFQSSHSLLLLLTGGWISMHCRNSASEITSAILNSSFFLLLSLLLILFAVKCLYLFV